jgi:cob(I)alamin adenosyltransferase
MKSNDLGLIHIYCGDGKGKTTCSVGLTVRASGYGLHVLFMQFLKKGDSSELCVLRKLPGVDVMKAIPVTKVFVSDDRRGEKRCKKNQC